VEPGIERVTKLEAARRQLSTAITLFFDRGDSVSVHTLSAASQEILRGLGRRQGLGSMFKDSPLIKPEKRKELGDIFNAAQNFFKHADKDPDAVHDFRPAATPFNILDAVELYGRLTGSFFPEAEFFRIWFFVKFPHVTVGDLRKFVDEARDLGVEPDNLEGAAAALVQWKRKRTVV